jgi:hypothetical protein
LKHGLDGTQGAEDGSGRIYGSGLLPKWSSRALIPVSIICGHAKPTGELDQVRLLCSGSSCLCPFVIHDSVIVFHLDCI